MNCYYITWHPHPAFLMLSTAPLEPILQREKTSVTLGRMICKCAALLLCNYGAFCCASCRPHVSAEVHVPLQRVLFNAHHS